jgi:hypothetical protein
MARGSCWQSSEARTGLTIDNLLAADVVLKVYNAMIDRKPALIAQCADTAADTADVIAAVRFGRDNGLLRFRAANSRRVALKYRGPHYRHPPLRGTRPRSGGVRIWYVTTTSRGAKFDQTVCGRCLTEIEPILLLYANGSEHLQRGANVLGIS